jgi:hypothetical protein
LERTAVGEGNAALSLFTAVLIIIFFLVIVPIVYWVFLGSTMAARRRGKRG